MSTEKPNDSPALLLNLAFGTTVRIGEIRDPDSSKADFAVDFNYVTRGRLSRYQVRKAVKRFMVGALRRSLNRLEAEYGRRVSDASHRKEIRFHKWSLRHVALAPNPVALLSNTTEPNGVDPNGMTSAGAA